MDNRQIRIHSLSYYTFLLFLAWQTLGAQTLVIDPGHGGKDPGKPRGGRNHNHEKDINLKISLKLGQYIQENLPQVKVLYTRKDDRHLSLEERAEFANKNQADFFISIHANSNGNAKIHGTETHIYSREMKASLRLAQLIEEQFATRAARKSRGIFDNDKRGHNLYVTQYTRMPSVLVETGYMSNPKEEKYLNSNYGQAIIASAIFRAFRSFIQEGPPNENRLAVYRVQIMASPEPIDPEGPTFEKLEDRVEELVKSKDSKYPYKYVIGREYELNKAQKLVKKAADCGFDDAFVILVQE